MKKLLAIVLGMFTVSAMADITLDGPTFITSNTTVSEKVTGSGYYVVQNGATLTLSNAENDFTGGVICSNGVVEATASGAFGTGTIRLEGSDQIHVARLNVDKGVFPNDFVLKDATTDNSYPALDVLKSATLNGKVSIDSDYAALTTGAYFYFKLGASASDSGVTLTLNDEANAGAARFKVMGWGKVLFKEKVTAASVFFGHNSADTGMADFYADNAINGIRLGSFDIGCHLANQFKGTSVQFDWGDTWYANGHCRIILNGFDQEFRYLHSAAEPLYLSGSEYACGIWTDDKKPCTVTINGRGALNQSGTAYIRFAGPISVVVEKVEPLDSGWSLYQGFKKRESSVTNITVKSGQFRFMTGVSFPQLENVDVVGGSMTCESVSSCVPNVKRISVANGASVTSDAKSVAPITAPKTALYLETGSHFYVGADVENTVKKLYLDGVLKEAGTYTGETEEKGIVLQPMRRYSGAETFYTGILNVLRGPGSMILVR